MDVQPLVAVAGLLVGLLVGLTGMGGGALLTPLLVLGFGTAPLVAVSSDLVAALVMKPVGGLVHLRRGTVDLRVVGWLTVGSVPSAFLGVLALAALGDGADVQSLVKRALGVALLLSATAMLVKPVLVARASTRDRFAEPPDPSAAGRRALTVLIGVVGGFCVGLTSVGSGSLVLVLLMLAHPGLTARSLVGTDLVQAVPLVAAAAVGHLLFGQVELGLTASLLIGAVPGVYVGARISSERSTTLVRRLMVLVLFASGLKLVGTPTPVLALAVLVLAAGATLVWLRMDEVVARWRSRSAAGSRRRPPPR